MDMLPVKPERKAQLENYARRHAFRVEITREAENDSEAILEWLISQQAGETGLRWFQGLGKAIASLAVIARTMPTVTGKP